MFVRPVSLAASAVVLSGALMLSACGSGEGKAEGPAAESEAVAPASASAAPEAPQAVPAVFDLNQVPISTADLGAFPYVPVTSGYEVSDEKTMDLAAFPIWTGAGFQVVEGKVRMAESGTPEGKEYSRLEFERGIENAIKTAGGVRIANGVAPNELIENLPETLRNDMRLGLGPVYGNPFTSYVIRRPDRIIWVQVVSDSNRSAWTVVDAPNG